jgi:hypothetical protein
MGKKLVYIHYWMYDYIDKFLDEHGGGSTKLLPGNKGDYQKWWIEDIENGFVKIRSYRSGNLLDSNADGNVYTLPDNGGHYQHWRITNYSATSFNIQNRATGRYLSERVWTRDASTDKNVTNGWGNDDCRWTFLQI